MKKSGCARIGRLFKPHGIKGELSVKFESGWLKGRSFRKQKFLFVEIYPGDDLVPFFIEWAEADNSGMGRIKFEDFNSVESIGGLVNKDIFVTSDSGPKKFEEKIPGKELWGFLVSDKISGTIGIVHDILENEKQQMLLIKKGESEILIPLVKEFIIKVDKQKKIILMKIPEGLINLNP